MTKFINSYNLTLEVEKYYLLTNFNGLEKNLTEGRLYNWSFLTRKAVEDYNNGTLSKDDIMKKARKSYERKYKKILSELDSTFNLIESANDFEGAQINVDWSRSRAWGMNPHACAIIRGSGSYRGTASGCGYDKLSASVAEALNQSYSIKKLFVAKVLEPLTEKWVKDGKTLEELAKHYNFRQFFPYGTGYHPLTFFEGGVGVECYHNLFGLVGFTWSQTASGKTYDIFTITKK